MDFFGGLEPSPCSFYSLKVGELACEVKDGVMLVKGRCEASITAPSTITKSRVFSAEEYEEVKKFHRGRKDYPKTDFVDSLLML